MNALVPLSTRLGALQLVRTAMGMLVLGATVLRPQLAEGSPRRLVVVTVAYVAATGTAELARRWSGRRRLRLSSTLLLVDGVWLALALLYDGGAGSAFSVLLYVHVVAVTLLVSYRSGLEAALWHGLLLFVAYYGQLAAVVGPDAPLAVLRAPVVLSDATAIQAGGLLLVAIAAALFASVNEGALRRHAIELGAFADLADELAASQQPTAVVEALVDHATTVLGFQRTAVADPSVTDEVVTAAGAEDVGVARRSAAGANPWLDAVLHGADEVVAIPMVAGGQLVATLVAEPGRRRRWRAARRADAALARSAAHAALALRGAALLEEIEQLARVDALTGLPNRRAFEVDLQREVDRSDRTRGPLTLALIDVDHFKQVNDVHGHQVGDEVLQAVATAIRDAVRDVDLEARYGGEEFAVLLPDCPTVVSATVADRVRRAISAAASPVPVTASIGIATYPANATTLRALVQAADEALYESKRAGRDRCTASRRTVGVEVEAGAHGEAASRPRASGRSDRGDPGGPG